MRRRHEGAVRALRHGSPAPNPGSKATLIVTRTVQELAHAVEQTSRVIADDDHAVFAVIGDSKAFCAEAGFNRQAHPQWRIASGGDPRATALAHLAGKNPRYARYRWVGLSGQGQADAFHRFGLVLFLG